MLKTKEHELKEKLEKQDKICDDLIKKNPLRFHDNEFETLTLLQAEFKGYQLAKQDIFGWIKNKKEKLMHNDNIDSDEIDTILVNELQRKLK